MNIFETFLDILFPSRCLGCGIALTGNAAACSTCLAGVRLSDSLRCGACLVRLSEDVVVTGFSTCHPEHLYILGTATSYETRLVRELVKALKFERRRTAAVPLGELLDSFLDSLSDSWQQSLADYCITPLPLGRGRQRERGFNQAELLAHHVAKKLALPVTPLLQRIRETKPQSTLIDAERSHNVKRCFAALQLPTSASFPKNIIIIDDVSNSGATFSEAATALRAAGAEKIIALAVAKA